MKIRDLQTFVVGNPPPGYGGRYFLFVKLTTDTGITGIGEVYCATFGPKAMTAMAVNANTLVDIGAVFTGVRWVMKDGRVVVDRR